MFKKICLFGAGLFVPTFVFAQEMPTTWYDIYQETAGSGGILDNGIYVWNLVVVILLAVVTITLFVKIMRKVDTKLY